MNQLNNEKAMRRVVEIGQGRIVRQLKKDNIAHIIDEEKSCYKLKVEAIELLAGAREACRKFTFSKTFKTKESLLCCLTAPAGTTGSFSYDPNVACTRYCIYLKVYVNCKVLCERDFSNEFFWVIVYFNDASSPRRLVLSHKMNDYVRTYERKHEAVQVV